jgi:Fe-S-cluster containining protein
MSLDWYPAIRACCAHWPNAAMLHQTFEALEKSFEEDNDACIDCAKCLIEVICRVIIDELDDPARSIKPKEEHPSFGTWVSTAVRILKLGDIRDDAFRKLISQHHKLTTTLGDLRNGAGPVSHGKDGFIERLSSYHRRAAVLSADAIVAFLHQAYTEAELNLERTREPYERFRSQNGMIDERCGYQAAEINEDGLLEVTIAIPGPEGRPETITLDASPSQFLFHLDRMAYIEALNASVTASIAATAAAEAT